MDPKSPVTTATLASESEGSFFGFFGAVGSNRRLWDETAWPTGPGFDVSSALNSFSPLLGLGCEEGLCFDEKDDSTVGSGEKGVIQSNPIAQPMSVSQLDGVELEQEGPEQSLIQWKSRVLNPSDCLHGEDENGLLECSPLSKWDPNDHKGLKVIQEGDEGEARGSEVKNSKWVCSLMKFFCRIVGFPIVKHEDQCLALFHLLEQDCVDVGSVGSSKGLVNSKQKGLRELKGLFSSINYDGVATKGRNRDFLVGMRAITSFK